MFYILVFIFSLIEIISEFYLWIWRSSWVFNNRIKPGGFVCIFTGFRSSWSFLHSTWCVWYICWKRSGYFCLTTLCWWWCRNFLRRFCNKNYLLSIICFTSPFDDFGKNLKSWHKCESWPYKVTPNTQSSSFVF